MQGPELSRAFMLRYDLYRHYFPLMALGRALRLSAGSGMPRQRCVPGPELSRAFMLRFDLYRHCFPVMALGRALRLRVQAGIQKRA
jgi:hypothetical protein